MKASTHRQGSSAPSTALCLVSLLATANAFSPQGRYHHASNNKQNSCAYNNQICRHQRTTNTCSQSLSSPTALQGGIGIAKDYEWEETQYEIDVTVTVPAGTRSRDIRFRARPDSVDLRIKSWNGDIAHDVILLDGRRKMRGKVSVDGTYWAIADTDKTNGENQDDDDRQITVTIEKMIVEPDDQFEVIEYDWYGVYPDDEEEVTERKYDEPEELDVRDYAASLGVDIDNINMSMVDKTMFSAGMNMTKNAMDELTKAGYAQEVTQQSDGREYITDKDGSAMPFSPLGENIGKDEIMNIEAGRLVPPDQSSAETTTADKSRISGRSKIRNQLPFIDTHSKWHDSIPAEEVRDKDGNPLEIEDDTIRPSDAATIAGKKDGQEADDSNTAKEEPEEDEGTVLNASDPIDLLTVKRLKEILREQNLKVSGNKQELIDRLRAHVNSKLQDDNE